MPSDRDLEGVGQADQQRPGIGVGGAVGEEGRLADLEPGLAPEECETARDAARLEIGERVQNEVSSRGDDQRGRERLNPNRFAFDDRPP